jgi:hypothetical protein
VGINIKIAASSPLIPPIEQSKIQYTAEKKLFIKKSNKLKYFNFVKYDSKNKM